MKMKFKELPKPWRTKILLLSLTAAALTVGLIAYAWCSVGELFMVMF